jgi:hypothetical protein
MGHQESLIHLDMLWSTRYALRDKMVTSGEEDGFWNIITSHLKFHAGITPHVSDSHAYGYHAAQGCEGVIIADAHHDCWDSADGQVGCDNWLRVWLKEVPTRWAIWVYPEHAKRIGAPSFPEDMADQLTAVKWEDFKKDHSLIPRHEAIGAAHVCRSGCWTPPWLDHKFIDFFSEGFSPDDFNALQDGAWDPLAERWNEAKEDQAKALQQQMDDMMSKQVKVVPGATSKTFLNGRVEHSVTK